MARLTPIGCPTMLLRLLVCALLCVAPYASAEDWRAVGAFDPEVVGQDLFYAKRTAERPSDGKQVTAHLAFFKSPKFRLEVIDLGADAAPAFTTLEEAFRAADCVAGVNGGFFHADWRPAGLMIAKGSRSNRFETAKLLSGVIYADDSGIHLIRRSRFRDHSGIDALLQTGPYLVEGGRTVRGLSDADARRRTFIATDWRGHWVLGATSSRLTLADLGESLASAGALTPWTIDRAINLDGGSSTGFYYERGPGVAPVVLQPAKRVRNLLGITLR